MVIVSRFKGMRFPTCDSCGCKFILPIAATLIVTTGANLVNNSHPIRRVWSFNYYILNWILDTFNLVYFITVLFYFHLLQLLVTIELFDNCLFRSLVDLHYYDCFSILSNINPCGDDLEYSSLYYLLCILAHWHW